MPSELAGKISTATCGEVFPTVAGVARYVDEQLQEFREVLDECEAALAAAEPYVTQDLAIAIRERRQRARQLAERLRVG